MQTDAHARLPCLATRATDRPGTNTHALGGRKGSLGWAALTAQQHCR